MFSITGKHILTKEIKEQEQINIPSISQGVYLYSIETETRIENGKLIIKEN